MEPEEAEQSDPVRHIKDKLAKEATSLAAENGGDQDECQAHVPTWVWEKLNGQEQETNLVWGWFTVHHDDELAPDNAIVSYHHEGKLKATRNVEISPPALEAMADATQSA